MPFEPTPVMGGRSIRLPLFAPMLAGKEWTYVRRCLDSGWISSAGPYVTRFERKLADYVGVRHAVATSSGTAALHMALKAIGLRPGEEVLVPCLTFVAPVNAITYCGAVPVFMDADSESWQMDDRKVERFLKRYCRRTAEGCLDRRTGRRVRAILPVHLLGSACRMDNLSELARWWRLKVVEDAAEGMGVLYDGRHVGTYGDMGVFSFNGNKLLTTGGGGMVVSRRKGLAEEARYLSTQAKDAGPEYFHRRIGFNYRMSNLHAAVGLAQLEQIERFIRKKVLIAELYRDALGEVEGIQPMPNPPRIRSTYWLYTVTLRGAGHRLRTSVMETLRRRGIEARSLWHPIHLLPPYRHCTAFEIEHAERIHRTAVSLPSGVGLTSTQVKSCAAVLREVIASRQGGL